MCFPSVPTRYWAVWWEWTVNQEPLGSGKFRPHLMPSPLPWLLQPREYFIPTPLRCDAVTVSARTGLLRHEQLISERRPLSLGNIILLKENGGMSQFLGRLIGSLGVPKKRGVWNSQGGRKDKLFSFSTFLRII